MSHLAKEWCARAGVATDNPKATRSAEPARVITVIPIVLFKPPGGPISGLANFVHNLVGMGKESQDTAIHLGKKSSRFRHGVRRIRRSTRRSEERRVGKECVSTSRSR